MNFSELNETKMALPEEKPNHVGGEPHKYEGGRKKKTMKKKAKKAKKGKKAKTAKRKTKKTGVLKKIMKLFK